MKIKQITDDEIYNKTLELASKKEFHNAIIDLRCAYSNCTPRGYNRALQTLLFHFCVALGAQGAYLTTRTYDALMKLPMYKEILGDKPFMASTVQKRLTNQYSLFKNQKQNEFTFKETNEA